MEYLEPFLANFSFIVIPFFLYQMFWVGRGHLKNTKNKIVLVVVEGIAITLCMAFPMHFSNGFIYDLRYVPFILGIIYGGMFVSIPNYLLIIIYRYFIGGGGFYVTFIVATVLIITLLMFRKRYHNLSRTKQMGITISIAVAITAVVVTLSQLMSEVPLFSFQASSLNFTLIQGVGMWLMTYLVQTMLYNVQLHQKAIHTEKLNVVSELSASISHEVRNPLTVTKGFLQLLRTPELSYEKRKSYVELSLTELERAEMIINDYLAMTKPYKETIIISNLKDDLNYITGVIKPYSIIHKVHVLEDFNNNLECKYDRNQLRQCLLNILKNCIEAMPYGGTLKINTISVKNKITIKIKDTGVGMTKGEIERLGTPYYTTKEKGTGLGMTVVFSAIHAMHGKINIESEKGFGTLITITLPCYIH